MAKQSFVYVLMYGKRPIACYASKKTAERGLEQLKLVIPKAYPVKPALFKCPKQ